MPLQSPAGEARVQFEVIENSTVTESPQSCGDFDAVQIIGDATPPAGVALLMPGVFYFRRELRNSLTRDNAIQIGLLACHELEQLQAWVYSRLERIPPRWMATSAEAFEVRTHCSELAARHGGLNSTAEVTS